MHSFNICLLVALLHIAYIVYNIIQVYLAMEAGYTEKVDELCERYSLEGFVKAKGMVYSYCHFPLHVHVILFIGQEL